jgi:hypothetical protein
VPGQWLWEDRAGAEGGPGERTPVGGVLACLRGACGPAPVYMCAGVCVKHAPVALNPLAAHTPPGTLAQGPSGIKSGAAGITKDSLSVLMAFVRTACAPGAQPRWLGCYGCVLQGWKALGRMAGRGLRRAREVAGADRMSPDRARAPDRPRPQPAEP